MATMPKTSKVNPTRFKNKCFVGLNKVEFHSEGGEVLFADSWQDITDDQTRKSLMLAFFAPRDVDGEPVDPVVALAENNEDEEEQVRMLHQFQNVALFDFCRIPASSANTINVLIVADVIFHWDMNDSYIMPTSSDQWTHDLKQILKSYGRSITKNIYTSWDVSKASELENVNFLKIDDLQLDTGMWINRPSIQEKFGWHAVFMGTAAAVSAWFMLGMQETQIQDMRKAVNQVRQQSALSGNFRRIRTHVETQEQFMKYRYLNSLILQDLAYAVQQSNFKIRSFTLESVKPNTPPDVLLATLQSEADAYEGYLEEEPVAKELLRQSVTMTEVRKPPVSGPYLVLEGKIPLPPLDKKVRRLQKSMPSVIVNEGDK